MSSKKKNSGHTAKSGSSVCAGIKAATRNYKMALPNHPHFYDYSLIDICQSMHGTKWNRE